MSIHEKINYVEFPSTNIAQSKLFFSTVFEWEFQDFGPEYCAFTNAGLDGGFYLADKQSVAENGAALVVFYSNNIKQTLSKITAAGGVVTKPIFSFPGGCRFHFTDTTGNEFSVWSDHVP